MKKLIALLLSVVLIATVFTGCSLFSTGNEGGSEGSSEAVNVGDGASTGPISITDSIKHEDPADLEFETRYALTCGKNAPMYVDGFKVDYGVDFIEQIVIIYANADNKVVKEYDYYVFAKPEDADKYYKDGQSELRGGTIQDNVVCECMEEELVNQIIDMNVQYESMSENSATAYVQFQKEVNEMIFVGK